MATTEETTKATTETREQSMARIAAIPADELLNDFYEAAKDLQAAELAVGAGRHEYQYRIVGNKKQLQVIQAEIKRRMETHDDLLAACKALVTALRESSEDRGLIAQHGDALDEGLKAIAKAEAP